MIAVLKESREYLRRRPETVGFREPELPILSNTVPTAHISTHLTDLAASTFSNWSLVLALVAALCPLRIYGYSHSLRKPVFPGHRSAPAFSFATWEIVAHLNHLFSRTWAATMFMAPVGHCIMELNTSGHLSVEIERT
jgi:hypothetical protein